MKSMMYTDNMKTHDACGFADDAAAYLAGELDDRRRAAFDAHLARCPACSLALEQTGRTLAQLKAVKPRTVRYDLTPRILAQTAAMGKETRLFLFPWSALAPYAAAAAVLLLLAGAAVFWARHRTGQATPVVAGTGTTGQSPDNAAQQALAWLCHIQESDGSWRVAQWGGDSRFEVALTALSVLALAEAKPMTAEHIAATDKAVAFLCLQQNEAGEFGPAFSGTPYNHGMATLALLKAFKRLQAERMRPALDAAVAAICLRQSEDGGWGYWDEAQAQANLSISLWQLEALKLAVALGWEKARPNMQHGAQWIAGVADDSGFFGYRQSSDFPAGPQTLTAMGAVSVLDGTLEQLVPPARREAIRGKIRALASDSPGAELDYYRTYFVIAALKQMQEDESTQRLADIRGVLLAKQEHSGTANGSWLPHDQWSGTGGRLYATAMASLSLR